MTAGGRVRRRPSSRTVAVTLAGLVLAAIIAAAVTPSGGPRSAGDVLAGFGLMLMVAITGAVGLLVAWHQPRNPIGWLLLAASLLFPVGLNATAFSTLYVSAGSWGRAAGELAFLLSPLGTAPIVAFPLVILLFPDGRLPSRRWRWVVWVSAAASLLTLAQSDAQVIGAMATRHFRLTAEGTLVPQPWMPHWMAAGVPLVVFAALATVWITAIGRQVIGWRRSSGDRRQQLKWLAAGGAVFGAAVLPMLALSSVLWEVAALAFAALPVSIGIGILKYRLYEIDRIISRTLAYALVTGLLVGVYIGLVLLATQVLRFSSPVSVAVATLVAAALFSPLRRRVQGKVDRRFNRARYDADAAVRSFAGRLQDAVDLDGIRADLLTTVSSTLQPAQASVWVPGERP